MSLAESASATGDKWEEQALEETCRFVKSFLECIVDMYIKLASFMNFLAHAFQ